MGRGHPRRQGGADFGGDEIMGVDQLSLFGNYDLQVGNWTITTLYDERRKKWRLLINNRETIYNIKNEMMEWET